MISSQHSAVEQAGRLVSALCTLGAAAALSLTGCAGTTPAPASSQSASVAKATESASETASTRFAQPASEQSELTPVHYADLPLLPQPITSFGAAVQDGWLYVLGGYAGKPHAYSRDGQSGVMQRIRIANAAAKAPNSTAGHPQDWQRLAGIEPLQSVALVAAEGGLIRAGGMRAINQAGEKTNLISTDEVAYYLPKQNRWMPLPSLPQGRSSHDAIVLDGTLYVIGGWHIEGGSENAVWHRDGLALDLKANLGRALDKNGATVNSAWRSFTVPFQRRALAVAAAGGKLVAIGGMDIEGNLSQQVDVYDPRTESWQRGPDYPRQAFGIAATADGDWVYASGTDGSVHRWAVGSDSWQPVTTLAFPRFFHRLQVAEGSLWALGGIIGMQVRGRARVIERVALRKEERRPHVHRFSVRAPGPGKNRQGVFLHDNKLHVFGGNRSLGQHDFGPEYFLADGHTLHLASLTWTPMAPFPMARQTMQTVVDPDRGAGFAIGGFGYDGTVSRTFAEGFVYDLDANTWKPHAMPMPLPRSQFGLTRHRDHLWVFGGLDYDPGRAQNDQFRHLTEVLKVSLADGQAGWGDAGIRLPQPRRAFGGALLGEKYYLVGGMRDGFQMVDGCDVYDFATETWSEIPPPQRTRLSPQLIAHGGKLYLVGGSSRHSGDKLQPDPSIEVFDPATQKWSVVIESLPMVTKHMRAMAYGDRLLIYSAHSSDDEIHLMLIDPGTSS